MSRKYALIIGNTEYIDSGLAQLTAPGKDAEDFARVLKDKEICAFDEVNVLLNQPEYMVRGTIDEFFDEKKPDDLLVLYFSGHGVRDELGSLYLAVKNTIRTRLRSTAIKSDYIREAMDQSRSKRQVLILDCCNSGAFSQGTKAATGVSIGTATEFEAGYGRIILTASDSTQFAWEGDKIIGETDNSLFTHFLVQGLEGEADLDSDGRITVDELYDYAYEQVKLVTPKQTPSKFSSKQQGEIILRKIRRIEDIKPIALPNDLMEATEDLRTFVREGAVEELEKLLKGKNLGLVRSAREALERIEREDDSRRVSQAATQALQSIRQAEQRAAEEAESLAALRAEEQLAVEKAEVEQRAKEETERLLAEQKAERERKEKEEAGRLAIQKIEQERLAAEKAERLARTESERRAKENAERLAATKVEQEPAEREATPLIPRGKAVPVQTKPLRSSMLSIGIVGIVIIVVFVCGYAAIRFLPSIFGGVGPQSPASPTEAPNAVFTAVALTLQTQFTEAIPSSTLTLPPSATPPPTEFETHICDQARFVEDVTVPDGSVFAPGASFTKTWRLRNTGECTWSGYSLVFDSGDSMNSTSPILLGTVRPGDEVDISVNLVAPSKAGSYRGSWRVRNAAGMLIPVLGGTQDKSFFVNITVEVSGSGLDLHAHATDANWVGSGGTITFGGSDTDANGSAMYRNNQKVEDGTTPLKVLETRPQLVNDGVITGLYPAYTIRSGEHFKAKIGFLAQSDGSCGVGNAKFQLNYKESGVVKPLGEWADTCDGVLKDVDVDLSSITGKTVQFVLAVLANGPASQDGAVWVNPQIEVP